MCSIKSRHSRRLITQASRTQFIVDYNSFYCNSETSEGQSKDGKSFCLLLLLGPYSQVPTTMTSEEKTSGAKT